MKIEIRLSTDSIDHAISELKKASDNLQYGVQQTIEILTREGGDIAKSHTGGMAEISTATNDTTGTISETSDSSSDRGNTALIAEFGAGDTVINPSAMFENSPSTPVYSGAYSLLEGTKEYATYGRWHFGGRVYTQIEPRMGLFYAKQGIIQMANRVAQEVIKL